MVALPSLATWRYVMKMLATRVLATGLALAALTVAESAYAQSYSGFELRGTARPHDVRSGDRTIGRDPDAFIRGEILRHSNSSWPD